MFSGLLPVGTVVLLKNSTKRVMIIGVCQKSAEKPEELWDYSGCLFPEGYMGADKVFLFNHEQIEKIFFTGLQDSEQMAFKDMAEKALKQLRERQAGQSDQRSGEAAANSSGMQMMNGKQ